ncbi:peptide ABC transporter ATP-binding protein [Clostridium sp. chh4-2]|uniref:ABC transporter ATP-binding protein n=1 Tax=Clostridium sp. chh4-2 TaxID=2067550 RepID=UPI000CCE0EEE|nr:dipeptide ABC transporter ATP-binding protein [Clostridium sp. chh4-2]PNV59883.1 peptide ABC transporter ATP-binding protein [Clostridium sp. chh4-2]
MAEQNVIMEVQHLAKWFPIKRGLALKTVGNVKAVDDVSFKVYEGETLGLVGESGCGKTTLVRSMLRLTEPTGGDIYYKEEDFRKLDKKELKARRKDVQIVFQDPFGSLHPKMTIRTILEEPLIINHYGDKTQREERVKELMRLVDLKEEQLDRYPHEFSGGQRQRIVIARALATNPAFVVCDEPVSALDVSVRSQILNLLRDLQKNLNLTYLFISHDLSVIEYICDRVVVMYLGKVVELATSKQLFETPMHPYTQALLSAVPQVRTDRKVEKISLEGDIPSPANPPSGCYFHGRCRFCTEECKKSAPVLKDIGDGHMVACHRMK